MLRDTLTRAVDCLVAVTRYPAHLLTADADLENDLGIDSVKRVEIIVALSDEFGLDLMGEDRDPSVRSIGDIVKWIERVIDNQGRLSEEPQSNAPLSYEPQSHEQQSHEPQSHEPQSHEPVTLDNRLPNSQPSVSSPQVGDAHPSVPTPHFTAAATPSPPVEPAPQAPDQDKPLAGRVALVTGSGRGIGRTIARLLADRGANVIVNSFHSREQGDETVAQILARGGAAVHLWGSVANPTHVDGIFDDIEQQFGHLDILVCNASDGRIGSFLDLTPDDWDRAFRTNVTGHHQCAIRAAELMRPRGGGSIITMSAVGAHQFISGLGSQGVVKAAVETLTRYLACELGRFGIRVNCVAGGPVYGDLLARFPAAESKQSHWERMTPDGQLCSPMDLAETIAFLLSDQARAINGAVWMVDHGFSANADGQPLFNRPGTMTLTPTLHGG